MNKQKRSSFLKFLKIFAAANKKKWKKLFSLSGKRFHLAELMWETAVLEAAAGEPEQLF